jgi:hypothetical protein
MKNGRKQLSDDRSPDPERKIRKHAVGFDICEIKNS